MPSTTRGYPYPSNSDDVDVPGDFAALATAVDTDVAAIAAGTAALVANIQGTAIKSTGATAGYVLTAGTGGTATTWAALPAAGDAGGFSTASVSFNFSSANDTSVKYTLGSAVIHSMGVGGAGTVLASVQFDAASTAMSYRTFTIPAHTANATVTAGATANITAALGTTASGAGFFPDNNQASSTSIYRLEYNDSGGAYYTHFRKRTTNLVTNQWTTEIDARLGYYTFMKFLRFAPDINAWIGATDNVSNNTYPNNALVVNDTSGSVYKADFITNGGGTEWYVSALAYVPPSGVGNGTVYAFGTSYSGNAQRVVTYTVGSASISAASTVTGFTTFGIPAGGTSIYSVYWDSVINNIVVVAGASASAATTNYYQFDRTFTTLNATSTISTPGGTGIYAHGRLGDYALGSNKIGFGQYGASGQRLMIGLFGAAGTSYAPAVELLPAGTGVDATGDSSVFENSIPGVVIAPGGTITALLNTRRVSDATSGTATSFPIARKRQATGSLGTAATGRMLWSTGGADITVVSTSVDNRLTMDGNLAYMPTGGTYTRVATNSTATGTVSDSFYQITLK
jgi:hypothetical protein